MFNDGIKIKSEKARAIYLLFAYLVQLGLLFPVLFIFFLLLFLLAFTCALVVRIAHPSQ